MSVTWTQRLVYKKSFARHNVACNYLQRQPLMFAKNYRLSVSHIKICIFYNISLPFDMKGCICHFTKWQIHSSISKGTIFALRDVVVLEIYFLFIFVLILGRLFCRISFPRCLTFFLLLTPVFLPSPHLVFQTHHLSYSMGWPA